MSEKDIDTKMEIIFLDEFGHIGKFDPNPDFKKFKESPYFGLGGFSLPDKNIFEFSNWFYNLKSNIFAKEIAKLSPKPFDEHIHFFEKKGTSVMNDDNIVIFERIFKKIYSLQGKLFYIGFEKIIANQDSFKNYRNVMIESIKRLDNYYNKQNKLFEMVIDSVEDKFDTNNTSIAIIEQKSKKYLAIPPLFVNSKLHQSIQCADWICAFVNKTLRVKFYPNLYNNEFIDTKYNMQLLRKYGFEFNSVKFNKKPS